MNLRNSLITFLPVITNVSQYETILFEDALNDIKSDKYKLQVDKLRVLDKANYTLQKKKLPAYVFAGTFKPKKTVTNEHADLLSGLMICDVDHIDNLIEVKEFLSNLPFVACCFISPSGDGLKFCVHADINDIKNYSKYYTNLQKYFKDNYDIIIDVGKDFRRLCFVSHDSNIYINYNATKLKIDITEVEKSKEYQTGAKQTLDELKDKMLNWIAAVGRHECINKYIYMKIRDGANPSQVILDTQGFMSITPESQRDEHWQAYYNDINRQVNSAIDKFAADRVSDAVDWETVSLEDLINDSFQFKNINIPLPPGRFGELVEVCRQMALYRYDCLAFITACGLLAGMGGRRFNVSKGGLNIYMTLLMPTGYGKDSIEEIITNILIQLQSIGTTSYDFVGEKNHTGPKSLVQSLYNRRCQVSVFTEKGLMEAIQSGDKAGLLRTILGIYTRSGKGKEVSGEGYSDTKNNLPKLKSPSLTIIAESVPDSFLQAVKSKGAMTSGDIARQSLYMYDGDRPNEAEDTLVKLPDGALKNKLSHIARMGIAVQYEDNIDDKVIDVVLPKGYKAFSNEANALFNANKDSARGVAATRMAHKAYKYAALAAMINNDYDDNIKEIYVADEDWVWARNIVMYEMEQSLRCLGNSADGSVFNNLAINVLYPGLLKLQKKLGKHENGAIPCTMIRQKFIRENKFVYRDGIKDPTEGLDDVLEYCVGIGYLISIKGEKNEFIRYRRTNAKHEPNDRFMLTNSYLTRVKCCK